MTHQDAISALIDIGRWPTSASADVVIVERIESLLSCIDPPVADGEAMQLCKVIGPDDFFGMSWSLVHLIETAPSWPISEAIDNAHPIWAEVLRDRSTQT